ncbi:MAG TPA: peptidylprolyl isomerase [Vicinamibacterales bacterium]
MGALFTLLLGPFLLLLTDQTPAGSAAPVRVAIETTEGTITIEVNTQRAPRTAANFLHYVDGGFYDGGRFFRVVRMDNQPQNPVKIEVIQGEAAMDVLKSKGEAPPIALERTRDTGLRHLDGTVSMARDGPDTATHSFFICIGDQPSLDFGGARNPDGQGFAAFGRVLSGMDVVRRIQQMPASGQTLTNPVTIVRARRVE